MSQPEAQQTAPRASTEATDAAAVYARRGRTALWVTVSLLVLALVVLTVGLLSATRTDNVPASGYYPGIALSFGAFLGVLGIHLVENRRPMGMGMIGGFAVWPMWMFYVPAAGAKLVAAIIFISIGIIGSFLCAIVDGVIASEFIDMKPLQEGTCDYYTSGSGYAYDNYSVERTCNKHCTLRVKSNTCYCCYLYNCERSDYFFQFEGVNSCWDVIHLYRLLWASVVLNVISLFLGIITAAILGAYKDMEKPSPQVAPSPAPPPHILYNPNQHMLTYSGFCPTAQALPAYPNYPIPMQHTNNFQPPATPQMIPDGGSPPCSSEENQSQMPSQVNMQPQVQGATQDPGGYMLTPNAPALYGSSYSPFEKPPPYAC